MSRHSKNNTSLAFFTNAEREKLKYGTQKQRMGRDSMRNFDACYLCLQTARDPMCCLKGHISCKECIFENILMQKKEIARKQKLAETQRKLLDEEIQARENAAKQAEIDRFQRTQTRITDTKDVSVEATTKIIDGKAYKGIKMDEVTIYVPLTHDADKAKHLETVRALEKEAKGKPALPSFWVPSLTPDATPTLIEEPSRDLLCTACDPPHTIQNFKKLVSVKFSFPKTKDGKDDKDSKDKICPSCVKTLTNGSKITVLKGCGHMICRDCFARFVKTSNSCNVCDTPCRQGDAIELQSDGTGFAGSGGKALAVKKGVAFQ